MRLLHIADLHIGKRVCEFPMLEDQRHVLAQVVRLLGERKVDALLVAGDLYDKAMPSAEAVALVDWFLSEVAATGVPAIVIPGNHDSAERVAYAGALMARHGIHVAPVFDGHIEPVVLGSGEGAVAVWPIPFLRPQTVRHFFPEEHVEDYTDAMRVVIEACDLERYGCNVAVAHQFVTAGGASPERSDSEVSVGGLDNVDVSAFAGFDYVALGHIHRPQRIGADSVRYAGSILKYSFSEVADRKSAVLVTLGKQGSEPAIELVPLEPLHDMRRIRGPIEALTSADVVASADAEDYLQVVLTDEHPALDAMGRLRKVYPNVMGVEYDNARTRAAGLEPGEVPAEEAQEAPLDLFGEFYERQNGARPSEAQLEIVRGEFERLGVS